MTKSSLLINGLELKVHLGWPTKERQHKQRVLLDLDIWFPKPPKACVTDKLNDTVCYANLVKIIKDKTKGKKFHLIEHLCYELFKIIKISLPKNSKVIVHVTKSPKIAGLLGNVQFSYWDD